MGVDSATRTGDDGAINIASGCENIDDANPAGDVNTALMLW